MGNTVVLIAHGLNSVIPGGQYHFQSCCKYKQDRKTDMFGYLIWSAQRREHKLYVFSDTLLYIQNAYSPTHQLIQQGMLEADTDAERTEYIASIALNICPATC